MGNRRHGGDIHETAAPLRPQDGQRRPEYFERSEKVGLKKDPAMELRKEGIKKARLLWERRASISPFNKRCIPPLRFPVGAST